MIPVRSLLLRAGLPVEVGTEVFLSLIELPMREDMPELIRLLELPPNGFCVVRVVGLLVVIELPIREDMPELIRLPELPACGCVLRALGDLVPIKLPISEDLPELIRLPELADVCLPVLELIVVGSLLPIEMLEGLRVLELTLGPMVTGRLTVILPG